MTGNFKSGNSIKKVLYYVLTKKNQTHKQTKPKTIKENTAVFNSHTVKKKSRKGTAFSVKKSIYSFMAQM